MAEASRKEYVELGVAACGLPRTTLGAAPSAFVVLFTKLEHEDAQHWSEFGRTEVSLHDTNPNFVTKFRVFLTSLADRNKDCLLNFYHDRQPASAKLSSSSRQPPFQRKPLFLGYTRFKLRVLLSQPTHALEHPLCGKDNRPRGDSLGFAFICAEEILPRVRAIPVTIQFRVDHACLGSGAGKHKLFFVLSRELPFARNQWTRVYRSSALTSNGTEPMSAELETAQLTSEHVYANDESRRLLVEMYQVVSSRVTHPSPSSSTLPPSSANAHANANRSSSGSSFGARSKSEKPSSSSLTTPTATATAVSSRNVLVGSVVVSAATLRCALTEGAPMLWDAEPDALLRSGVLTFAPGSCFKGDGVRWVFAVRALQWWRSCAARDAVGGEFVNRDVWASSWARLEATGGTAQQKMWRGSSFVKLSAADALKSPNSSNSTDHNDVFLNSPPISGSFNASGLSSPLHKNSSKTNSTESASLTRAATAPASDGGVRRSMRLLQKKMSALGPWKAEHNQPTTTTAAMKAEEEGGGAGGGRAAGANGVGGERVEGDLPRPLEKLVSEDAEVEDVSVVMYGGAVDDEFGAVDESIEESVVELSALKTNDALRPTLKTMKPSRSVDT